MNAALPACLLASEEAWTKPLSDGRVRPASNVVGGGGASRQLGLHSRHVLLNRRLHNDRLVGRVPSPQRQLFLAIVFTSEADRITSYDVIADPDRLSRLSLAVLSAER